MGGGVELWGRGRFGREGSPNCQVDEGGRGSVCMGGLTHWGR